MVKVIELNEGDDLRKVLEEIMGEDASKEKIEKVVATIQQAEKELSEEGTYIHEAAKVGAWLMKSAELYDAFFTDVFKIKDRKRREDAAHALLHVSMERIIGLLKSLERNMPCMRDDDEMPSNCTKH